MLYLMTKCFDCEIKNHILRSISSLLSLFTIEQYKMGLFFKSPFNFEDLEIKFKNSFFPSAVA